MFRLSQAVFWMLTPSGASCWPSGLAFPAPIRMWWNSCDARQNLIWRADGRLARPNSGMRRRAWISETAGDAANAVLGLHRERAWTKGTRHWSGDGRRLPRQPSATTWIRRRVASKRTLARQICRPRSPDGGAMLPSLLPGNSRSRRCAAAWMRRKSSSRISAQTSHAWRSNELESGFEQRLSRFGQALTAHVDSRATAISEELQNLYDSIQQHRLGRDGGRRMERVAMAIRLARWLADQNATGTRRSRRACWLWPRGMPATAGFVDWARQVLRGGEPNKDLAAAFVRLVDRVTELREAENLRFGQALVEAASNGRRCVGLDSRRADASSRWSPRRPRRPRSCCSWSMA